MIQLQPTCVQCDRLQAQFLFRNSKVSVHCFLNPFNIKNRLKLSADKGNQAAYNPQLILELSQYNLNEYYEILFSPVFPFQEAPRSMCPNFQLVYLHQLIIYHFWSQRFLIVFVNRHSPINRYKFVYVIKRRQCFGSSDPPQTSKGATNTNNKVHKLTCTRVLFFSCCSSNLTCHCLTSAKCRS